MFFFRLSSLELALILFGTVLGTTLLGIVAGRRLRAHVDERRRREIGRSGVSTVVEDHAVASAAPPAVSSIVARHDVLIAIAIGGLLVAIGAGLLVATSDHLVEPIEWGLMMAVRVLGWFSAALYWLIRRPGNQLGLFLLALAVAMAAASLQGATQPQLRSSGVLASSVVFLLAFSVLFAFPEGRIASRFAWALLGAMSLPILEFDVPGSSSRRSSMAPFRSPTATLRVPRTAS